MYVGKKMMPCQFTHCSINLPTYTLGDDDDDDAVFDHHVSQFEFKFKRNGKFEFKPSRNGRTSNAKELGRVTSAQRDDDVGGTVCRCCAIPVYGGYFAGR